MASAGSPLSGVAWPDVVWDAPVLRGLDARARSEIQSSGKIRTLGAGEVLYRAGDPADAVFVVAAGACTLHGVRRGEVQPAVIRRASRGETFGEDATAFAFSTRQLEARSETGATVAEVPAVVLRRALGRAGGAPLLERIERGLRRAATLDLLRTASFTAGLPPAEIDLLLDAARHREVARGEPVYREGDPADAAFLVVDGLLQAQTDDGGTPRVEAYLARGDVFGDEEIEGHESRPRRRVAVVAAGPSCLVAFPADVFAVVARRAGDRLAAARRLRSDAAPSLPRGATTAHVFRDLYRMRVARSLLVIDQNACVRCGHCVSSCADAHDDGVSRLVRRGDKVVAQARAEPLMIPNSCQHCKNPSCMIDCPTGAIGRDARGEVFIREALCTGCGSCAKACPWDNIQLAPRKDGAPFPAVAVKCDLCQGKHGGPQCVAACPAEAIARIEPSAAFAELGAASTAVMPPRALAWPWLAGAVLASVGGLSLASGGSGRGRLASGVVAGVLVLVLAGYALAKRRFRPRRGARALFVGHAAVGLFAVGVVAGHAGSSFVGVAGALTVAFALAAVTGIFGAVAFAVLPRRLTRIERTSALPEELAALPKAIDERIFGALSGTSEAVKRAFVDTLAPYQRAVLGPVLLIVSGRSLREEEAALGARAGVREAAPLVRLVVEHRAVRAQRIFTAVLRGWLVPHLAATTAAIVLLVLHLVVALHLAGGGR